MTIATEAAAPPAAADAPSARRSPATAAALSVLLAGLGHLYAGRPLRGLIAAVAGLVGSIACIWLSMVAPWAPLRILLLLAALSAIPLIAADAWRVAARAGDGYRLRGYNRWYVYLALLVAAEIILPPTVIPFITANVARAWSIPGSNMAPTLLTGDYLFAVPQRGDVSRGAMAVFVADDGSERIQRVVGVPGDTLEMRARRLYLNGRALREPYAQSIDPITDPDAPEMRWQAAFLASPRAAYHPTRDTWGPLVVPAGRYFMLGDNRDNSMDSRYTGFVQRQQIRQRPVWIYFSRDPVEGGTRWSRIGRAVR